MDLTATPTGTAKEGMGPFTLIWLGQLVSLAGSQMTRFALILWAYEQTGRATSLTLLGFSLFAPVLLLSPFAGALVDRLSRRRLLILSSLVSAGISASVLYLHTAGRLEVWHLYVIGVLTGAVQSVAYPALAASMTLIVPKQQYGRASGMLSLAQSSSSIVAPPLAALLLPRIGLSGVLLIDLTTFGAAVLALLLVQIPQPAAGGPGAGGDRRLGSDFLVGFRYFGAHPGALSLQTLFLVSNLLTSFAPILLAPAILARTGQDQLALGIVQSAFGAGGIAGSACLAFWGGGRHRVLAILAAVLMSSGLGQLGLGVGRNPAAWAAAAFCISFFLPMLNGLSLAIWQEKVPPELQGRVLAAARVIAQLPLVVGFLLAGPLADHVFEPAMLPGGALHAGLGWLVGQGSGAGMGLMFVIGGLLGAVVATAGFTLRAVREAEERWDR